MRFDVQLLLVTLLIIASASYTLSISCYVCDDCPKPFNVSSPRVGVATGCKVCITASIDLFEGDVRKCSDKCDPETKNIKVFNFNYTCCDRDYCNVGFKSCPTYQFLFVPILIICFYISKKQ
ncbi:unnamed protein product [Trichobilharzia szidati]|nr:unnamed protein product [Trichobilharzia szidati]